MLELIVNIESCRDCRYLDHSGAFTKPKAQSVCCHSDASKIRRSKSSFREFNGQYYNEQKSENWKYWKSHWWHRVIDNQKKLEIPEWCPLRHGSRY